MNLIVICVDTFRADIIGQGKKLSFVKTPNLDNLATESVVFDRCFGEGEPTIPVRRCLFTGHRSFPWRFETPNEGLQPAGMGWHPIPHEHVTLAERLHDVGYCTGFIADTYHMFKPTMNFTRGFLSWRFIRGQENDGYRSGPISQIDHQAHVPDGEATPGRHPTIIQFLLNMLERQNEEDYLTAQVFRTASRWLEDNCRNSPFFLWIDSFSPHELWDVPRSYADAYFKDEGVKDYILPQVLNGRAPSEAEIERTKALYFGFVTYVDRWIGHLLETIDTLGLRDDTTVVFITDHGTEVWDKGRFSKGGDRLYPYNTQLNWFIRHPDGPRGKHVSAWTQNHDFVPTVLELLKVEHEPLDGHNVWNVATNDSTQPLRNHVITGWGPYVCVRDENYSVHLDVTNADRKVRIYDLKADADETSEVLGDVPQVVRQAINQVEALTGPLPTTFRQYEQRAGARSMRTFSRNLVGAISHQPPPKFSEDPSFALPKAVIWHRELVYGQGGNRDLKLDLFLPDDDVDLRPGIVFIHGGGWRGGSRNQFRRQAAYLASRGFVGACIEYRLSGEAMFPAAVEDVKCAVRWMRANAKNYRVDTDLIAAVGGSAGAHLAAILGTTDASIDLEGDGGYTEYSSKVNAVVAFNGVFDMIAMTDGKNAGEIVSSFLGGSPSEIPETYALASPITHIYATSAPCLLLHGTGNTTVPFQQSIDFKKKLESVSVHAELYQADEAEHGFFNCPPFFQPTLNRMEAFLVNWRYNLLKSSEA